MLNENFFNQGSYFRVFKEENLDFLDVREIRKKTEESFLFCLVTAGKERLEL